MDLSYLFITEIIHLTVTLLIIHWFRVKYHSLRLNTTAIFAIGLATGFFIDADHLFDHFVYLVNFQQSFSWIDFFSAVYFSANQKAYVLLHGWEYPLILYIIYWQNRKQKSKTLLRPGYLLLAALTWTGHLVIDQITNSTALTFYFLTYRWLYDFLTP